jgi:hypothetical protein
MCRWGFYELNKVHYGLTYHMLQTMILLTAQAIFGVFWFHREQVRIIFGPFSHASYGSAYDCVQP